MAIEVRTAADLNNVRNNLSGSYIQTANIDLSGWGNWDSIGYWSDIATHPYYIAHSFDGVYNGQNYTISGLTTDASLFEIITGTVRNIKLRDVSVTGPGALFNWLGDEYYGGDGLVENCSVTGAMTKETFAGGLGFAVDANGTLKISWAQVSITGRQNIGGFIGTIRLTGSVQNCYSRSSLTAWPDDGVLINSGGFSSNVGGDTTVINCYSAGTISTYDNTNGGFTNFVGTGSGSVSRCYWDVNVSGYSDSAAGEGRTTVAMTYPEATNTYVDWDFSNIWRSDTAHTINAGYPYFGDGFNIWVKKSDIWEDVPDLWVHKDGAWQPVTGVWTKQGGEWKAI